MKPFKILKLIFQAASTAAFLASLVFCALDVSVVNTAFLSFMTSYGLFFALAAIGTFLVSATSDVANRIGHGMLISSYAVGLTASLMYIGGVESGTQTAAKAAEEVPTAAVIMLVAAVLLALYYLCNLILKIMQKNSEGFEAPEDDIRIVHVREWKKIMEEGIISPEEYEVKRCQILGIKSQEKKPEPRA